MVTNKSEFQDLFGFYRFWTFIMSNFHFPQWTFFFRKNNKLYYKLEKQLKDPKYINWKNNLKTQIYKFPNQLKDPNI